MKRSEKPKKPLICEECSIKAIAIAVVTQAAMEAGEGNMEARIWIRTEAIIWLDAVGADIRPEVIAKWADDGYKVRNAQTRYQNMSAYANTNNLPKGNRRTEKQIVPS